MDPTHQNHQAPTPSEVPRKKSSFREFFSTIGVLIAALVIALGLIGFVFQSYEVDGPSMQTTLYNHDRLIVWKAARSWARITGNQYVPQRGDVIVFIETGLSNYGQDDRKQLIKRVIGLPGDRVVVQNGTVTIYNDAHPGGFKPDATLPYGDTTHIPYTSGNIDIKLDKNELFVCGDNRGDSLDSRAFGPITTDAVVGKLVAKVYPFSDAKTF